MIKKQEDQSKIDRITWEGSLTVRTGHHIAHPILCVSPHTIFAVVLWPWIIAWSGPLPFAVTTWFIASIPFSPSSPVPVDGRWNYREEILGCKFSFLAGELWNGRRRDVFRKDLKLPTISQLVTKRRFTPNDLYPVCLMTREKCAGIAYVLRVTIWTRKSVIQFLPLVCDVFVYVQDILLSQRLNSPSYDV